jgi:hypothetical protein
MAKSVLKYPGPRKRLRPCAKETVAPPQGPGGPDRLPALNPVSQPGCTKRALGLALPSGRNCGGWQGFGAEGIAAPSPQELAETDAPTGTA